MTAISIRDKESYVHGNKRICYPSMLMAEIKVEGLGVKYENVKVEGSE
jgi:hypothetical protein